MIEHSGLACALSQWRADCREGWRDSNSVAKSSVLAQALGQMWKKPTRQSRRMTLHKMKIALKESQETRYWLRTIMESQLLADQEIQALCGESDELVRIIQTIVARTLEK